MFVIDLSIADSVSLGHHLFSITSRRCSAAVNACCHGYDTNGACGLPDKPDVQQPQMCALYAQSIFTARVWLVISRRWQKTEKLINESVEFVAKSTPRYAFIFVV